MEKIDVSFYDGFQPIVNVHLRKLFDYINTAKEGNELNIYGTRMAKITDDNGKTYEMLYLNQNDFWQLRAIWKQKECCFKLSIFSRTSHRNIKIAKAYTVDDAEYEWLVWSKQIYNTCILNNENMLCFDRLRWAILTQAFDDYRLANNHLIRVKEALFADLKTLELSDQKRRALMNQRESVTYRMGQIRKELREINPKYIDMLPKLSRKRYSYISELLIRRSEQMKKEYNHNGIEIIRANNDQVYACFKLFGVLQLIRTLVPDLERRLKAIPYGKRDYMNALQKLDRISADIIQTYPLDKVAGMLPQAKRMVLECHVVKPVVQNPAYAVIDADDFDAICNFAFEGNCKLCTELNCDQCKLGKLFDRHMVKDRGSDDWMSIGLDGEGE